MTTPPEDLNDPAVLPDDAVDTVMESATDDLVSPPEFPDEDGPDASTVDSGGGPQEGASDDRDR